MNNCEVHVASGQESTNLWRSCRSLSHCESVWPKRLDLNTMTSSSLTWWHRQTPYFSRASEVLELHLLCWLAYSSLELLHMCRSASAFRSMHLSCIHPALSSRWMRPLLFASASSASQSQYTSSFARWSCTSESSQRSDSHLWAQRYIWTGSSSASSFATGFQIPKYTWSSLNCRTLIYLLFRSYQMNVLSSDWLSPLVHQPQ